MEPAIQVLRAWGARGQCSGAPELADLSLSDSLACTQWARLRKRTTPSGSSRHPTEHAQLMTPASRFPRLGENGGQIDQ